MTDAVAEKSQDRPVEAGSDSAVSVSLRNAVKRYGDVTAVDHLDLEAKQGQFLTLLGPSGCGKTTTLRLIGGFEELDEGRVRVAGQDVTRIPPYRRPVTTVFQQYALFPHLSVRKNIEYGLKHGGLNRKEIDSRVTEMMGLMEIPEMGDRRPRQLSGGQQQRVALARALVMKPPVLLLDEPLGSLDYKLRKGMQFELKRIHREVGATFVYVTHDQEEAMTMSDRIIVMRDGQIEQDGRPKEIFDAPKTSFVADFIGDTNLVDGTVTDSRDGFVTVDLGALGRVRGTSEAGLASGERARVSIRPTDVRVIATKGQGAVVTDAVLAGTHIAMKIKAGENEVTAHVPRGSSPSPGETVLLEVESERVRVFEAESE
jgi:spermidine/putrescine ABC transporter ATP-binding subunit